MNQTEDIKELVSALAKAQGNKNNDGESNLIKRLINKKFNKKNKLSEIERFFERLSFGLSDCWYWSGYRDKSGYGRVCNLKENFSHRLSWRLFFGEVPPGMKVLHKCDVRSCVNPDHLFLGDQFDNMRDMVKKKRNKNIPMKKENHPLHKLSSQDVDWIREMYKDGNFSYAEIAKILGVSTMTVCRANLKQSWKD